MRYETANGIGHHWREDGNRDGPAVVLAHSLGADLRLWDAILPLLPTECRVIRYDIRGHGLSACPPPPYAMTDLVDDAEALIEALGKTPAVFVGLSIGGMIGQGLAARRPDLLRALVLSNTAARLGTPGMWDARMEAIRSGGMEAVADEVITRWFAPAFRDGADTTPWRTLLARTPADGYLGCAAAIAGADMTAALAGIRVPTCAIAGAEDVVCSADEVAVTASPIPDCRVHVMKGVGQLPPVEAPEAFAAILIAFLEAYAHE